MPSIAHQSFQKQLIVDTVSGTVSIPLDKLTQVQQIVHEWSNKKTCTKQRLQLLPGLLLYIHKCAKPAHYFNHLLEMCRNANNPNRIVITNDCKYDLAWFKKFLEQYNGVSIYDHKMLILWSNLMLFLQVWVVVGKILFITSQFLWSTWPWE